MTTVQSKTIDQAEADNATAERGSASSFRAITTGEVGEDDDGNSIDVESHAVLSKQFTAFDMMTGNAEPFAYCASHADAELIASLLNKHFAN